MASRVIVSGATGLLGRQVVKAFLQTGWEVCGTGLTRAHPPTTIMLDLGRRAEIEKIIEEFKPQVVVHCAANRFPDKCDSDPVGTRLLNTTASADLASLCAARSIILIYISTDYVFPGVPGEAPYEADSEPRPSNLYGQTKWEGEQAVLHTYQQAEKRGWAVVLRVPVLYGAVEEGRMAESAVNVLVDAVYKAQDVGAHVEMDHWAVRYPTNTEDVARVCKDIATTYLSTLTSSKVSLPERLQFSSEERFTKYEICKLLAEILGLPMAGLKPNAAGNDPNAMVSRPYDCHLSTNGLKDLGIDTSTVNFRDWWQREVRAFRK